MGSPLYAVRFLGPHGDFDAVPGAEFGHEAGEVGLGGAEADVEFVGDFGVGPTTGHREQDSSSRSVSGSMGCAGGVPLRVSEKVARSRACAGPGGTPCPADGDGNPVNWLM